jgi:2-oxoglutarate ferredoxin oxidoreductase subunit beta
VPKEHDVTDEVAAYKLAMETFPGYFGLFYKVNRPTKNAVEANLIAGAKAKTKNASPAELLHSTFERFA